MNDCHRWSEIEDRALLVDLYELTMAQSYHAEGMNDTAVFELTFRSLPPSRNYLMACGLDPVLDYLESLSFNEQAINYLATLAQFTPSFLDWLARLRFTGDVHAVPEGTVVFAGEPVLQVVAPLVEAQIVETFVLNHIHYETLVASKTARVVTAAAGRTVVDFGMRRTHGASAAMMAARAGYVAGLEGTSNVLAGKVYGIPLAGTMAHSYVQTHDDEEDAFRDFMRLYPETTLVVDTYDTLEGVRKVIDLARQAGTDFKLRAVRLDSGDLEDLSEGVRRLLDDAGLQRVRIMASGNLDEHRIARLVAAGAPIDGFGVGTRLGTSQDAPSLDAAYKLVEYRGEGRMKLSVQKANVPWRKQVYRQERNAVPSGDVIGRIGEPIPGRPLLVPVMQGGRRLPEGRCDMELIRGRARSQLELLPDQLRALEQAEPGYPVRLSDELERARELLSRRFSWIPGEEPAP
ncbi:MAG TPA: nicotinate phosphoribosyltransferase [Polyangia bacterium]|nr:nicotinate phosphoribosyltransferase [Polyangia bacterium]